MKKSYDVSLAGLLIGLGLLLMALVIAYDALTMRVAPMHARVGPHIIPLIVASGLVLAGISIMVMSVFRGHLIMGNEDDGPTDWSSLVIIVFAFLAMIYGMKPIGFVICATVLFWATAFAFGSRHYLRDFIVALVMSILTYICFNYGLGLSLPAGLTKNVLP